MTRFLVSVFLVALTILHLASSSVIAQSGRDLATASTRLAALGASQPTGVPAGGSTLFTVAVSGASGLAGSTVVADLSAIGGSASQPFRDDGLKGDAVAGDGIFSYLAIVHPYTEPGAKVMSVVVRDSGGSRLASQVALNVHTPFNVPASATSVSAATIGAVDFNADGRGDLFRYDPVTGAWSMEIANGSGAFSSFAGAWSSGWRVYAGEFSGDARSDLFLYNDQTGAWYKAIAGAPGSFSYVSGLWSPGWSIYPLQLDGNSLTDVFLYNRSTGAWFKCLSQTSGAFDYAGGAWSPDWNVWPAQLNADNLSDLFLYNTGTGVFFRVISGGASFAYASGLWSGGWDVYPEDFSGDGLTDLLLYSPRTGQWFIVTNTGSDFSYATGSWWPSLVVRTGDFTGDRRADIFTYNPQTGQWTELINTTSGLTYFSGAWVAGGEIYVSDFNADRKLDLLLYHRPSGLAMEAIHTGFQSTLDAFSYVSVFWSPGLQIAAAQPRPASASAPAPPPAPAPAPPPAPAPAPPPPAPVGGVPSNPPAARPPAPPPNLSSVVDRVFAERRDLLQQQCQSGSPVFLTEIVRRLREVDPRWGFNWKRGNVGDLSKDVVDYHWGGGVSEGSADVYIVDVITDYCGPSMGANWTDVTDNGAIGRWTLAGRL